MTLEQRHLFVDLALCIAQSGHITRLELERYIGVEKKVTFLSETARTKCDALRLQIVHLGLALAREGVR